jgi:hypothetical protein
MARTDLRLLVLSEVCSHHIIRMRDEGVWLILKIIALLMLRFMAASVAGQ